MSCVMSENVICKHIRATVTYYVNLDFMPAGVTALSATADTLATDLDIDLVEVLGVDTTTDGAPDCAGVELEADRAIVLVVSGGTVSEDEVIITVNWVQSDGTEDSRDCRIIVEGTPGP